MKVLYVLKRYPRLSETFVVQEISGLEARGIVVAVDAVGAGPGEIVLTSAGSSARLTAVTTDKPVDAVIVGIVDAVETEGEIRYAKSAPARG